MYTAVFVLAPKDYYMAHGYDPRETSMRTLERPLEFIEKGLVLIFEKDYVFSKLVKMPRIMPINIPKHG